MTKLRGGKSNRKERHRCTERRKREKGACIKNRYMDINRKVRKEKKQKGKA